MGTPLSRSRGGRTAPDPRGVSLPLRPHAARAWPCGMCDCHRVTAGSQSRAAQQPVPNSAASALCPENHACAEGAAAPGARPHVPVPGVGRPAPRAAPQSARLSVVTAPDGWARLRAASPLRQAAGPAEARLGPRARLAFLMEP